MAFKKIRDFIVPIITFAVIIAISTAIIAYGKGYRLDYFNKSLKPTGLIAATSDPTGAQILIDGVLKSATNNTLNIAPGWYSVAISKEGYQTWEKKLRVQGEVVTRADAYLFPSNPSPSRITTNGVVRPSLSPDGARLAFIIPEGKIATSDATLVSRSGIWILDLTDRPLGLNRDDRQIAKSTFIDFTDAILTWSPDSKQIIATIINPISKLPNYYLLDADKLNESAQHIDNIEQIYKEWQTLAKIRDAEKLTILKPTVIDALSPYIRILNFTPDDSKVLYEATAAATIPQLLTPALIGTNPTEEVRTIKPESIYVYDIKEDRNYLIGDKYALGFLKPTPLPKSKTIPVLEDTESSPVDVSILSQYTSPLPVQWLPTSRHLILVAKEKIEAMDFDATNRKTLYNGPFWDGFVVPWGNASKILILTSFNSAASTFPNIYAVNLR